jgi:hypothetical protein
MCLPGFLVRSLFVRDVAVTLSGQLSSITSRAWEPRNHPRIKLIGLPIDVWPA